MNANLRPLLLALACLASATLPVSGSVLSAQAQSQSAATPVEPPPCDATTPGAAGSNGCTSKGVIRPPVTGDQGGVITPPDSSKAMPMPVIPPPGSPGGDQNVQPK